MSINTKYIYLYIYGNTCLEIIRRSYAGVTYHCWELQLPFHLNGSYRFRTVVTVPERHMPWHYRFRTVVTVSERQLPFQNGSYRSRTAYAMVCQWSRWHMPQAIKRSRRLSQPDWNAGQSAVSYWFCPIEPWFKFVCLLMLPLYVCAICMLDNSVIGYFGHADKTLFAVWCLTLPAW